MSYNNSNNNYGCEAVGCCIFLIIYVLIPLITYFIDHDFYKNIYFLYSLIALVTIVSILISIKDKRIHKKCNDLQSEMQRLEHQTQMKIDNITREYKEKEAVLSNQNKMCHQLINSSTPFTYSASLKADMEVRIFEEIRKEMISKERPAWKAAEKVAELARKTRIAINESKAMTYKLDFLLQTFPEIKRYFDDDEALISLADTDSYNTFIEERDKTRDYLSDEEWKSLSINKRNQLALDRWRQSPKSNWMVGMLYEMYIGHLLRPQNFNVIQFGIINGLNADSAVSVPCVAVQSVP